MKYEYKSPKFFAGQKVLYKHHNGSIFEGKIIFVETHYGSTDGNVAYHIYCVMRTDKKFDERPGFKRYRRNAIHVGEKSIISLINENTKMKYVDTRIL